MYELDAGEKYLADGVYHDGGQYSETPNGREDYDQWMKGVARARHENINQHLKQFGILERRFRHDLKLHHKVFMAVANIVQASIQLGDQPPFHVEYFDNY